ncbi:MAG: Hpt domain-containing protein [Eubacterium sp.]|nr:Hpt domain-containing protein [Eubacterium sp.]
MTIEELRLWGADVDTGVKRCAGKESLYLKLVDKMGKDQNLPRLRQAIEEGDLEAAFEAAHGLKGLVTNLSLTPLSDLVVPLTEDLRAGKEKDYGPVLEEIQRVYEKLILSH